MATAFESSSSPVSARAGEPRFFFILACAISAVLVAGFALNLAMGRSSFGLPLVYHVHAFVFFGWLALFLTQTWLMASGNAALHRRLGWLSAIWVPAMVVVGMTMTVASLRRTGGPFFFDANEFLFGNIFGLLTFAAMIGAALALRRRTDWHRRLMLCAVAAITGPGFGRLLPMPLFIPWGWEISNSLGIGFMIAGMIRDQRSSGRIHPAWFVGVAVVVAHIAIGEAIAYTPWAIDLTQHLMAGYPGAARPMQAYLP